MNKVEKIKSQQEKEKTKQKERAVYIVDMIVTERRVEKELYKMRDKGIIPEKISLRDLNIVAKYLPKRISENCVKEETTLVEEAGEYFEKTCSAKVMKCVKALLLRENDVLT